VQSSARTEFLICLTHTRKGIGEWDKVAIAYGYQDFAPGTNEAAALDSTLRDAFCSRP
jgi:hypothetical protein